jgi:uridine kinase
MDIQMRSTLKRKKPFLIGVAGGVSSGKSSVCKKIVEQLAQLNNEHKKQIMIISFDSFYRHLTPDEQLKAQRGEHNFDHPTSFDDEKAHKTLIDLINGKEISIQVYDNKTYSFKNEAIIIKPSENALIDVLIVEGILVFYYPKIRELFQMKLFVDCDADTRLSRRVLRDMGEYNRDLEQILAYYTKSVKPAFEDFCLPTKKYADVIIPRGAENQVAINLIVQHIDDLINHNQNFINGLITNGFRNTSHYSMHNSTSANNHSHEQNGKNDVENHVERKGNNTNIKNSNSNISGLTINTNNSRPNVAQQNSEQQHSPLTPSKRIEFIQRPH